ncbi:MAG TPA: Hsp20/alpha crystallin family protein [Acidimicrobiales bacterium]|nr:Hsp20/alpha crystallin family protein [Acidimicrobiales bacterium]
MALLQWDPWRELSAFERQVNELFGRSGRQAGPAMWAPALEAFHTKDDFVVRLELPGIRPEEVDVQVTDNVLVIRGERHFEDEAEEGSFLRRERSYGRFERQVLLPEGTEVDSIKAHFDLGVLEVRIPHPKSKEPTRVPISTGSTGSTQQAVEVESTEKTGTTES